MTSVDVILDQSTDSDVHAATAGVLRFAAREVFAGRPLNADDHFRLWAASTAAHARLIELRDVQRIKTDVAMERWADAPAAWVVMPALGRVA